MDRQELRAGGIGNGPAGTRAAASAAGQQESANAVQAETRSSAMKATFKRSNVLVRITDTFLTADTPPQNLCKIRVPQNVQAIYHKSAIRKIFFR